MPSKLAKPPPGTDESMPTPGAKRSTCADEFENPATVSVSSVAPTVIAVEMQPGALTALPNPSLPEAIAVAVPAESRLSTAALRASVSQALVNVPPPMLMFTDEMSKVLRRANTRCRPASWSEVKLSAHGSSPVPQLGVPVNREKTWIAIRSAPGATPSNAVPSPAAIPATWVPCRQAVGA